eukprot:3987823-Prorocentrum_lima.AAC.1
MVACITERNAHYTCTVRHSLVCLEAHSSDHRHLSCVPTGQTTSPQQCSHLTSYHIVQPHCSA